MDARWFYGIGIAGDLTAVAISLVIGKTLLPIRLPPRIKVVTRTDNPRFYWLMIAAFSLSTVWCVANLLTGGAFGPPL